VSKKQEERFAGKRYTLSSREMGECGVKVVAAFWRGHTKAIKRGLTSDLHPTTEKRGDSVKKEV